MKGNAENELKREKEVADLVSRSAGGARVNNIDLTRLVSTPEVLTRHLQNFSVLRNPDDIVQVLSDMLAVQRERKLSQSQDVRLAQSLFDALFNQPRFVSRYTPENPLKIAMFRGGRGASALTSLLADLPNVALQIVIGATDDGRSWYHAAANFNATGVPDAGKSLLDLARDEGVRNFLSARLVEDERSDLHADFADFISILEGETNPSPAPQIRSLLEMIKPIAAEKRNALLRFLDRFQRTYGSFPGKAGPAESTGFSFHNIPLRSIVLVGAAWQFDGDWQKAADEVGALLDTGPHRVLFPTAERQHLMAMTADGVIYFAETGINEHPKNANFLGLWLMRGIPDIREFSKELSKYDIQLKSLEVADSEIRNTTRKIARPDESKLQLTADLIAKRSTSAHAPEVPALDETEGALRAADIIVYAPTTLESNIGSALIVPGLRRAIRANTHAAKIHFVNPTLENDKSGTSALDMVTRLARYASGQQAYLNPKMDWEDVNAYVEYVVGIGEQFPRRDENKHYIPFDEETIRRDTGDYLIPIPLNLELPTPVRKQRLDYKGYDEEYGFYDPILMKETLIALLGIKMSGANKMLKADDEQP